MPIPSLAYLNYCFPLKITLLNITTDAVQNLNIEKGIFIKINPKINNTNPVNIHLLIPNLSNIAISFEAQGPPPTPAPSQRD